ncbi:hypothetical protein HWV01_07315 [Moritella sp. 5]|nr:hypothetical protein HWV01_07315 [Moritella sp. 5]
MLVLQFVVALICVILKPLWRQQDLVQCTRIELVLYVA